LSFLLGLGLEEELLEAWNFFLCSLETLSLKLVLSLQRRGARSVLLLLVVFRHLNVAH